MVRTVLADLHRPSIAMHAYAHWSRDWCIELRLHAHTRIIQHYALWRTGGVVYLFMGGAGATRRDVRARMLCWLCVVAARKEGKCRPLARAPSCQDRKARVGICHSTLITESHARALSRRVCVDYVFVRAQATR